MKKILITGSLILVTLLDLNAWAKVSKHKEGKEGKEKKAKESASATGDYEEPFGMAGCGLWSLVIKEKSKGAQIGSTLLRHLIGDSQTSAITTGSSNCVQGRAEVAKNEQEVFMEINLASLTKEAAQGEGEHLVALAELLGCPHDSFIKLSQEKYQDIYNTPEAKDVLSNYKQMIRAQIQLQNTCPRV